MECKYCHAQMPDNTAICPKCGKDNTKDDLKVLKIITLSLVCLVMLVLLAGLVCYGVTGSFVPPAWTAGNEDPTDATDAQTAYQVITKDGLTEMKDSEIEGYMDTVIATMGDYSLTNRDMQLYYWMVAYTYGGDADMTVDLDKQIYDEESGQTYHDYFVETALDIWQETMMMAQQAKAHEYVMPDEQQEALDAMESELESYVQMYNYYYGMNLEDVDDLVAMNFGPGCNFETYYNYYYYYFYGAMYWSEMYVDLEYTDEEINDYFTDHEEELLTDYSIAITKDFGNLIDIRSIMISVKTGKDADGNTVEDWDATLAAITEVYDLWVANGGTKEAFIELVAEYSEDDNSSAAGGLYTDQYKGTMRYVDVRHILIEPDSTGATQDEEGNTVYTDAAWAAALTEAEALLEQWKNGEMTEESFGALANEHSDDQKGKVTNGGLYEDVYIGRMVKEFENWCFDEHEYGDTGIVKTIYGYHIMFFVRADREVDDWISDESRQVGDVAILKGDDAYYMVYFDAAEPAWYRYCRYGVQADKAEVMLDGIIEANPYTFVEQDMVIAYPAS